MGNRRGINNHGLLGACNPSFPIAAPSDEVAEKARSGFDVPRWHFVSLLHFHWIPVANHLPASVLSASSDFSFSSPLANQVTQLVSFYFVLYSRPTLTSL